MSDTRARLMHALRTDTTLPALRASVIEIVCDMQEELPPTLRSTYADADAVPDTERDAAPSTQTDSEAGREFAP